MSLVGRNEGALRKARALGALLGWSFVELGPETDRVVVLGGRAPTARVDAARAARGSLEVLDADDLDTLDVADATLAALRAGDHAWLQEMAALRRQVALPGADLRGVTLTSPLALRLDGADLTGARIQQANLVGTGLILRDARVEGRLFATLHDPDLRGLQVPGAIHTLVVDGGRWDGVRLQGDIHALVVRGADLTGVAWDHARLGRLELEDCRLDGLVLGAGWVGASVVLHRCSLRGARLALGVGAELDGCDLSGADLRGSALAGADLSRCVLDGADLTGVALPPLSLDPPVEVPVAPCSPTSIRVRAHGLDVELTMRGALGPAHRTLEVAFRQGEQRRRVEVDASGVGGLVAALRTWDLAPSWSDVAVSGHVTAEAGRRYWAGILGVEPPGAVAPPAARGVEDLFDRVRQDPSDPGPWAVLLDALQGAEGLLGERVRRVLAGELPGARLLGLRPGEDRIRYRFHAAPGRVVPFLSDLMLRKDDLPLKTVRALAADPACALLTYLAIHEVPRECGRFLALPVPRLYLSGSAAHRFEALFNGTVDCNPHVRELSLPRGFGNPVGGSLGTELGRRFPGLRAVYVGSWDGAALAGLSVDRLYLDAHHVPLLDLAGCRAREVRVRAWADVPGPGICERRLRALDGVEVVAVDWVASDGLRAHLAERGARLESDGAPPRWMDQVGW